MTGYITGVLVTVWVICIASLACYGGRCDVVTKGAFAVLLFYTVLLPLAPLVEELDPDEIFENIRLEGDFGDEEYEKVAEEAFCDGIRSLICEEYGVLEDEVRVAILGFDFKNMTAERIRITLLGRASLKDYKAIERYVESFGEWECDAEIEIG